MSAPQLHLWALGESGDPDRFLADVGDYRLSLIPGQVGTVQVKYPTNGAWFTEVLRPIAESGRQVEVELRLDGTSDGAEHALLVVARGDDLSPGAVWELTGYTLGVLLRGARVRAVPGAENGELVISGTPGTIVRALMVAAHARGVLTDVGYATFSATHDSNGVPWPRAFSVKYSPGRDYASIVEELETELGAAEWSLDADRQLRLYVPGTRGQDRTIPANGPQVTLEHGRDLGDAPVTASTEESGTTIVATGAGGLYSVAHNAGAIARYGRVIEVDRDYGSVEDQGTLDALAQAEAAIIGDPVREESHKLVLGPYSPTPGVDYGPSDWVLRAVRGTVERRRVVQLMIQRTGSEVTAAVTLGDLIQEHGAKTRKLLERLANGSGIAGTSTASPTVDDGKAPARVGVVSVSSAAYSSSDGTPLAQVSAEWPAVTTNADGTPAGDVEGYQVEFRWEPGQGLPESWQRAFTTGELFGSWSPVVSNRTMQVRVRAVDQYQRVGEWSPVQVITTARKTAPPDTPSTPTADNYLGLYRVRYDGRGSQGQRMAVDVVGVEIHISPDGPQFVPHRPNGAVEGSSTYQDLLRGAGEQVFPLDPDVEYWVKLVAVDRWGNPSSASAAASATPGRVEDGDVRGLSIGKLIAGIMQAVMTVSGIIRTAATGARVELDTTGLRCISADGQVLFEFHIPTSLLSLAGRLIAGAGVGLGPSVVVSPGTTQDPRPYIAFHPTASLARLVMWARNGERPDGTTGAEYQIGTTDANNVGDGFILSTWATNFWLGFRQAGVWSGPRLVAQRVGGLIGLYSNGTNSARVAANGNGQALIGNTVAALEVTADNSILVRTGSANKGWLDLADSVVSVLGRTLSTGSAALGNGFQFKAANGDGQGFRMVWDQPNGRLLFYDLFAGAYVTQGAGSPTPNSLKTFVIDHPTDPDRHLVHVATESPHAGVEYWGEAVIYGHLAVVELPPYFEAATRAEGRAVQVSMVLPDEPLQELGPVPPSVPPMAPAAPPVIAEHQLLHPVAASYPRDGRFRISSPAPDGTRVSWHVHAIRADVAPPEVEPLRSDYQVHGDGPYRYLTRRPA